MAEDFPPDLVDAARTVGLKSNPYHEALVLKHIKQVHRLRSMELISDAEYQRVMAWHQIENLSMARKTAGALGYKLSPQRVSETKGHYRTGSDSDYHVRRKDGRPLTLEDIQAIERAYRVEVSKQVRERSRAAGKPVAPPTHEFDTVTDFMVAWDATTEAEFNRIAAYHKSKGADTYSRYGAVIVESQLRDPNARVDIRGAGMYVNEMIEQAAKKEGKIRALREKLKDAKGAEAKRLEGEIRILTDEHEKYVERINDVNARLAEQAGVPAPPKIDSKGGADYRTEGPMRYVQTLGRIASSSPQGSDTRRYARFVLALRIYDMPEAQRRAYIGGLDSDLQREVKAQVQQFREQEQQRVSQDHIARLQNFLRSTETGRRLLDGYDWAFKELTKERSRTTQSMQFLGDVASDLGALDQHVGNRAMQLSMWLDVLRQTRDAKSTAELAISLGRTFASRSYYGMIAGYAYTGLVEGDTTALAKSLIILLCPKAALPQVVKSIGDTTIDLTTTVLFDHQFKALFLLSEFDEKTGALLNIAEYGGSGAPCQFLDDALLPGGYKMVEGAFDRALALGKEKNLSLEMLSGINVAGSMALVRALQSTIYGGAPQVMKSDSRLLGACAEVNAYTTAINDFVEGLGRKDSVPLDADEHWADAGLEPAAQRQLTDLLKLRSQAWGKAKTALCDGIRASLETRYRAMAQLEQGRLGAFELLHKVELLFKALDMYDLGMSWLCYDAGVNFVRRGFVVDDKEQRIKAMEVLQRYHAAYSAVHELRETVESSYVAHCGNGMPHRPLTGTPPLTADPDFDKGLAGALTQEALSEINDTEERLLWIKRDALNDTAAQLDANFDRCLMGEICGAIITVHNCSAVHQGAAHARSRLYKVQVLAVNELFAKGSEAHELGMKMRERKEELIEEFKEHYKACEPALAILPPPAIVENRAAAETDLAFRVAVSNVPAEAVFTWYEDSRKLDTGPVLLHAFKAAGSYELSVVAVWVKSERVKRDGSLSAKLICVVGAPGSDAATRPSLSIEMPAELAAGDGKTGTPYRFRARGKNIPKGVVFNWFRETDPLKPAESIELVFDKDGPVNLSVSAEWDVAESGAAEEVWARAVFHIGVPPAASTGQVDRTASPEGEPAESEPGKEDQAPEVAEGEKKEAQPEPAAGEAIAEPEPETALPGGEQAEAGAQPETAGDAGRPTAEPTSKGARGGTGQAPTPTEPDREAGAAGGGAAGGTGGSVVVDGGTVFYGQTVSIDLGAEYRARAPAKPAAAPQEPMVFTAGNFVEEYAAEQRKKQPKGIGAELEATKADYYKRFEGALSQSSAADKTPTTLEEKAAARAAAIEEMEKMSGRRANVGPHDRSGDPEALDRPDGSFLGGAAVEKPAADTQAPAEPPPPPPPPPPVQTGFKFVFQASPNVTFDPVESTDGRTTVMFDRLGEVKIWAQVLDLSKPEAPAVETAQTVYRVASPSFQIACAPPGAKVGEDVRAQVTAQPAIPENLVRYVWFAPPSSERMEFSGNAGTIGFKPRTTDPVALQVEARTPHYGETLGVASDSYQPSAYTVTAAVLGRAGPRPLQWDPVKKGLVPVPEGEYTVHEEIRLRATLTGTPKPDPLRWSWTVNEGTTMRSSGISDSLSVARSEPGNVTATVTATDRDGRVLGTATVSASVSIGDDQLQPPKEPPVPSIACDKTAVDPDETVSLSASASGGTPPYRFAWNGATARGQTATFSSGTPGRHTVGLSVTDKLGQTADTTVEITVRAIDPEIEKQKRVDELLKQGYALEQRDELPAAIEKYREAQALTGDARVASHIAELEAKLRDRATAADLLAEGYALEKRGDLPGAVEKYRQSLALDPNPKVQARMAELEKRIADSTVAGLIKEAEALEKSEQLEEAIARYEQAQQVRANPAVARKIEELTRRVKTAAQVAELLADGYSREQAGDFAGAVSQYQKALRLKRDPKVEERIALVKKKMADKLEAQKLARKGRAHEQKEEWAEALDAYQEAQALAPDPKVAKRIENVQAELAAQKTELERRRQSAEKPEERVNTLLNKGYAHEQKKEWADALDCYERAQKIAPNPKVAARIEQVRRLQRQEEEKSRLPPKQERQPEQARVPVPANPKPAAKKHTPAPAPKARAYNLNGSYRFSSGGEGMTITIRQKGNSVRLSFRDNSAAQSMGDVGGVIKGDSLFTDTGVELKILDNGNTLEMRSPEGRIRFKR
ncbi:MAG: hypothetical protein JXR37_04085 [Kiritimatiellae bacterium]|nr:hypothetical protein [Kiritimatiellia bacterium]